jgi:hypothetical protein
MAVVEKVCGENCPFRVADNNPANPFFFLLTYAHGDTPMSRSSAELTEEERETRYDPCIPKLPPPMPLPNYC